MEKDKSWLTCNKFVWLWTHDMHIYEIWFACSHLQLCSHKMCTIYLIIGKGNNKIRHFSTLQSSSNSDDMRANVFNLSLDYVLGIEKHNREKVDNDHYTASYRNLLEENNDPPFSLEANVVRMNIDILMIRAFIVDMRTILKKSKHRLPSVSSNSSHDKALKKCFKKKTLHWN